MEGSSQLLYIAMVEAFKNGPHATTPLCICMNSSLKQPPPVKKSLNDCLMKGPPALVDLFTITLSFREHRYALAKDLSKFYQKVEADELTQHMRRILWRDCDGSKEMRVYVTTTVNFGDRPAGCITIAALKETAERYGADLPIAAWYLKYRTFVNDAVAGSDTQKGMIELSGDLETLAGRGGFQFKGTLMTGDAAADLSEPRKVLGLIWETQEDKLQVDVKLNTGGKVGGARIQEDIDLEGDLGRAIPGAITKRVLWRVAQGLYDPLGLLCAFTIQFKIVMRSLSDEEEGGRVGWDDQVPAHMEADFREILGYLKDLKKVSFPRSLWPEPGRGQVKGKPMLLIFGDGSVEASCALAYLRWEMEDGSVVCRLLAGKTRVTPKCKISIPRMELMGSLVAVRLYQKIKDSLRLEMEGVRFFMDSSAVLGMINKDSGTFLEFVGTRVSEIRTKSKVDTEWFWIPGELNPADMGTRPTMTPGSMGEDTPYQKGLPWMYQPVETWPVRKDFTPPPVEECRKDVTQATCSIARAVKGRLTYPVKATSRAKLVRIFGYVLMAAAAFKKRACRTPLTLVEAPGSRMIPGPPPRCNLEAALDYLVEDAQRNMVTDGTTSLEAEEIVREHAVSPPRWIKVVMARGEKYLKVAYDAEALPILPHNHPLSRLILKEAHAVDHGGVESMTMRSRAHAWVVRAKKLAKSIKRGCFTCRRRAKVRETQKMAPLPEHRMGPAPVFESTAVDLFGPITFQDTINKRGNGKAWGVVFVCTATSLVHVEVTDAYSTDSFLLAVRRFMAMHGAPSRFQSDQGTQLVAAAKQIRAWDWTRVHSEVGARGAEWHLVPTGAQHFNGQAERMIGLLKPCLEQAVAGKRYSYGELATVMAEAAQVVNSRPIARGSEDTQAGGPIIPLHLQLGRATVEVPRVRFEEAPSLTRRLQHADEGVKQFWRKWMHLVFQEKLLSRTWRKAKRNVTVGDVVYMMEKDDDDEFCRMGIVEEVKEGPDGCIRTATVKYTNPGGGGDPYHRSAPKSAVRPIHKLAVIVPVDYRFEEDLAEEQARPREPMKIETNEGPRRGKEWSPGPRRSGQEDRPRRETAQKAMDALRKGADATRGRGKRKGRMYQRAGTRN